MSWALTWVVALRQRWGNWIWWTWDGIPNRKAGASERGYLVLLPCQRHPVGRRLVDGVPGLVEGGVTGMGGLSEWGLVVILRRH